MQLEEFARMTRRVISNQGFDDYLPTAIFPGRQMIMVLEGIPVDVDVEKAALAWASRKAQADEEFLVAYKSSDDHFKVARRADGKFEVAVYSIAED
ncbi:hypothetical protein [Paludisphaera rhizosphaerae]|uniref:hypothetical protein n=1 Tax=Paludisphaera rhizosphaerae TaxID=2711216 RepID=UPI0013EC45CC|nr:hypothetical protein [Paludisphaera rhizosphaerae]